MTDLQIEKLFEAWWLSPEDDHNLYMLNAVYKNYCRMSFMSAIKLLLPVVESQRSALEFYANGNHFEIIRTRGQVIEYDVDAGPLYNYEENLLQKDSGEKAQQNLAQTEAAVKKLIGGE
jgi:hypothetical protein